MIYYVLKRLRLVGYRLVITQKAPVWIWPGFQVSRSRCQGQGDTPYAFVQILANKVIFRSE